MSKHGMYEGVTVLYQDEASGRATTSSEGEKMSRILERCKDLQGGGKMQARGLCSRVYRIAKQEHDDDQEENEEVGNDGTLCVKRVMEDEQRAPHSVVREVICYRTVWQTQRGTDDDDDGNALGLRYIMPLLAAFRDASDEFDPFIDLVMPFHPCTLQDMLNEPALRLSKVAFDESVSDEHRLSFQMAKALTTPVETFVRRTIRSLFSALAFLHERGIAHRDVKPSNVLVRASDHEILLIDFGTCSLPNELYAAGDDGRGGMASEVGTGAYRSPECLLSPLNGYDPTQVDVWQAGATLIEFFLPIRRVARKHHRQSKVPALHDDEEEMNGDDRLAWEKALWSNDRGQAWSTLRNDFAKIDGHAPSFYTPDYDGEEEDDLSDDDDDNEDEGEIPASGWRVDQLFDGSRGDLGLANSIFTLLGLPKGDEKGEKEWPEAVHFQPSLRALPFARRTPTPGGLRTKLIPFTDERLQMAVDILDRCIQLSASRRISASEACARLDKAFPTNVA